MIQPVRDRTNSFRLELRLPILRPAGADIELVAHAVRRERELGGDAARAARWSFRGSSEKVPKKPIFDPTKWHGNKFLHF